MMIYSINLVMFESSKKEVHSIFYYIVEDIMELNL